MIREAKVVTCCPENRFCPRDGKNHRKIPVRLLELKFLHRMLYTIVKLSALKDELGFFRAEIFTQNALYNCETFVCSEFFVLSCRSAPKKFFTTCFSVFHRFCHVLYFLTFANVKLAFSLQKLFGNLEKQ